MANKLPSSFENDKDFYETSRLTKLRNRVLSEPLIPIGCLLTCWALYMASKSIRRGGPGSREYTNKMFRRRIYAQGFTIVAMVGGSYWYADEHAARHKYEAKAREAQQREKNRAWIKELEAREEERVEIEKAAGRKRE